MEVHVGVLIGLIVLRSQQGGPSGCLNWPPIADLPEGIGIRPVEASNGKEAFEIGHRLFPGCWLAGVARDGEDDDETP